MDTISSAEFRKRYASLESSTEVTVNGHVIGTWEPTRAKRLHTTVSVQTPIDVRYDQRPFTPVPKVRGQR